MDNHVHMIIKTNKKHNISKVMQAILLSFSAKYRRKCAYVGHVWQGPFHSNPIENEGYILECLEYLHNNPVRAKIIDQAREYQFSSAQFYEGTSDECFLQGKIVLTRYGDTSSRSS